MNHRLSLIKLEEKIGRSEIKIMELSGRLNAKTDEIINKLTKDTNKKAAEMKKRAADKGFQVICELVEVEIGNQTILIDPLRIAGY